MVARGDRPGRRDLGRDHQRRGRVGDARDVPGAGRAGVPAGDGDDLQRDRARPGTLSGAWGYRHELKGYWRQTAKFAVASFLGAIGGTILLLSLPKDAFEAVVPILVGLAVVLVIVQPRVSKWVAKRREENGAEHKPGPLLMFFIFLIGIYGGYFTAAQGVMLMAVMGMLLSEPLQKLNGVKNVLAAVVNVIAGLIYAFVAPISWPVVLWLAIGSTAGGFLGAKIGRKLPPAVLRGVIVVVGTAAVIQLVVKQLSG